MQTNARLAGKTAGFELDKQRKKITLNIGDLRVQVLNNKYFYEAYYLFKNQ